VCDIALERQVAVGQMIGGVAHGPLQEGVVDPA